MQLVRVKVTMTTSSPGCHHEVTVQRSDCWNRSFAVQSMLIFCSNAHPGRHVDRYVFGKEGFLRGPLDLKILHFVKL